MTQEEFIAECYDHIKRYDDADGKHFGRRVQFCEIVPAIGLLLIKIDGAAWNTISKYEYEKKDLDQVFEFVRAIVGTCNLIDRIKSKEGWKHKDE